MDAAKLGSSVSAGVSAICKEQSDIIFDLQQQICQQPLNLRSVLMHISKLEKKNLELFSFDKAVPSEFHRRMFAFADVTFKLRFVIIRPFCSRSVPAPASAVCDLAAELVKINMAISMMVKGSAVGSGDEVTKICEALEEEILKLGKLFALGDAESVIKVVSSISEVNDRFLPLLESLPRGLPSRLSEMHAVIHKLRLLYFQENGIYD